MTLAVIAIGAAAEVVAWWFVASARASVWAVLAPVLAAAGAAAILVGPPPLSGEVSVLASTPAGLGAGVTLYAATLGFVALVGRRWSPFRRDAERTYRGGGSIPTLVAVLLAAGVVAVGEELFWRGLVQAEMSRRLDGETVGAAAGWLAYVVANAPSRNLAILAGALVGGAVWSALAWWSSGVLASVLAHATWTALMTARPVVTAGEAIA